MGDIAVELGDVHTLEVGMAVSGGEITAIFLGFLLRDATVHFVVAVSRVAACRGIVCAEISKCRRELNFIGEIFGVFGAIETVFKRADRGTAVAGNQVAIIAFFASFPDGDAVTAYRLARTIIGACENLFSFAERIAAVASHQVAVIAFFASFENLVAASAFLAVLAVVVAFAVRLNRAFIAAFRSFFACFGTFKIAVAAFRIVGAGCARNFATPSGGDLAAVFAADGSGNAFVADFVTGDFAVTADVFFARFARVIAVIAFFALAEAAASVAGMRIQVIAFFITGDEAVTAHFGIADLFFGAYPACFDTAGLGAAVASNVVAVFASLLAFDDAVTAFGLAAVFAIRTTPACFNEACGRTAISGLLVAVIAGFTIIERAIAAVGKIRIFNDFLAGIAEPGAVPA